MRPDERDKLYDWLENGRVDVYLRRLMRERLEELETALADACEPIENEWGKGAADDLRALLVYRRPERHGGADEAMDALRSDEYVPGSLIDATMDVLERHHQERMRHLRGDETAHTTAHDDPEKPA